MIAILVLLMINLDQYVGHNRVLLLFAPNAGDSKLVEQRRLLAGHGAELKERDLLVFEVLNQDSSRNNLRRTFRVGPGDFRAVLIGKDGGEKWWTSDPAEASRIFAIIDTMPMREYEIKNRKVIK